jgi:hypothetical protein
MRRTRPPARRSRLAVLLVIAAAVAPTAAAQARNPVDPFQRPARPSDRLPRSFDHMLMRKGGVARSRRIAVYNRNRHSASLYLVRTSRASLCAILVTEHAAGGGCYAGRHLLPLEAMYGLHYAAGTVGARVATLLVLGTHGRRHRVPVTDEGGFIYRCRAFSGCTASVRSITAYDERGHVIGSSSPR